MRSVAGFALLFTSLLLGAAPPPLPDTPPARQAQGWLNVINAGDAEAIRRFYAAHYPAAPDKGERDVGFSQASGGLDVLQVLQSAPASIVLLVRPRQGDQFGRLTITADSQAIQSIQLEPTARPKEFIPARLSQAEALVAAQAEAARRARDDTFAGAILIARQGQPLWQQAYGLADRQHQTPNRLDTRFRIGSMNKMFTAVATLQLVQKGKLQLDLPISRYLPDYPNRELASKVTIHHLLTHTGGVGDFFGPEFDKNRLQLRELQDYVKLFGSRALQFEPGAHFDYSNYGYLLLGVIIERVTGQSYYDYVDAGIFRPAGMTRTGSLPEDQAVPDRASGYMRPSRSAPWEINTDTLPLRGTPAGGGYSTVEDLLRFSTALLGHKLLNAHYTDLLTTGKVPVRDQQYAYGFFDGHTDDGVRWFGHSGGAPGMNGDLRIYPDSGYVVAVLSNCEPPAAEALAAFAADRLPLARAQLAATN